MPNPTLLMIRPLAQAMDFVQTLTARTGKMPTTMYSPVIETRRIVADPPEQAQFLLFSSVNGVRFYADQSENRAYPALCVGATTAQAAAEAGFVAHSADGTAADLLTLAKSVAAPDKGPLIYVCGTRVAHDLDGQLADMGYRTKRCVVYDQTPLSLTKQARSALQSPIIIPVSSPNTARGFADQTAHMDLSNVTFVFISENARAPLLHTDTAQILATAPTRDTMISAISRLL